MEIVPMLYSHAHLRSPRSAATVVAFASLLAVHATPIAAQEAEWENVYRTPHQVLVDIVDAPPTAAVSVGPDFEWLLLMERPSLPPIAELAERELRLAGMRIKPQINARSRTRPYVGLRFVRMTDRTERAVTGLPDRSRLQNVRWAPNGKRVAFTHTTDNGIELWVAEVATGKAMRLTGPVLNLTTAGAPAWLSDSETLICTLVPSGRGPEPEAPRVPTGPVIQENIGKTAPARTYQDLLKNAHDEALFEHYTTAQLARVTLEGQITPLGAPGTIWSFSTSPSGEYLLVQTLQRPYSYLVPARRFPRRVEVLDLDGRQVHLIADLPLQEEVPTTFGSVPTGPRSVGWRSDVPATLVWTEAQDGGDAGREADVRDRVYMLAAPFRGQPVSLITLGLRYGGIQWGTGDLAFVYESWWRNRKTRTWIVQPGTPGADPELLWDRSFEDRYGDPGSPDTKPNAMGRWVTITSDDGTAVFLIGTGASPEGDRPFVDRLDLGTKQTTRLFRSEAPYYERPIQVLDNRGRYVLTLRESVDDPPNYFVRDLEQGTLRQVTSFPNPTPQLTGMHKELIRYKRADGVDLTAMLYLPPGYNPADGPLPMLMWAYPREFKSADAAGQVTSSPYRFSRLGGWSTPIWLTQGYAVLDGPTMPIIGEGDEEPNDTYVEQLVSSAKAAVDEMVRRGVTEHGRIGIGGHSYGAFMAANLLAHSDLFAAGIARSGAYNRTLTPFGFQAEERTVWEAVEIYFAMSPFMHADKVNEPILLIHGEADNNSGTFPLQSRRYYHALKGLGKTTRLVMLPHESHGYRARESILHMLWEMQEWLDKYVKQAAPLKQRVSTGRSEARE
ncbi:MAG: prolyl oligopeptidase family serine peptidase [Acidimicrobiia bacterium]